MKVHKYAKIQVLMYAFMQVQKNSCTQVCMYCKYASMQVRPSFSPRTNELCSQEILYDTGNLLKMNYQTIW